MRLSSWVSSLVLVLGVVLAGCATKPVKEMHNWSQDRMDLLSQQIREQEERLDKMNQGLEDLKLRLSQAQTPEKTAPSSTSRIPTPPAKSKLSFVPEWESDSDSDALADKSSLSRAIADSSHETMHWYFLGLKAIDEKQYDNAVSHFRKFLKEDPRHVYADRAHFWIEKAHYLNKEYALAVVAGNQFLSKYPFSFRAEEGVRFRDLAAREAGKAPVPILESKLEKQ